VLRKTSNRIRNEIHSILHTQLELRIYWINSRGQQTRGGPRAWGLGEKLTTPPRKNTGRYEILHRPSEAGCCEHGNEVSGSIKGGEFLDRLSDYQLLKEDSGLVIVS
jgi:hypothetical protein